MENLTKEEFIEEFIESLGDNEILGQVISTEKIKDILEDNLAVMHWGKIRGYDYAAGLAKHKSNGKVELYFIRHDKEIIIHEVLHLLSNKVSSEILKFQVVKGGLSYGYNFNLNEEKEYIPTIKSYNKALNEGMTEALTLKILGKSGEVYPREKYIYGIISSIVGEKEMLEKYFSPEFSDAKSPLNMFKDNFIEMYGKNVGTDLNDAFKKISVLADKLMFIERYENPYVETTQKEKMIKEKIQNELHETLFSMIETALENEPDLDKKCKLVANVGIFDNKKSFTKVLEKILQPNMDSREKVDILKRIGEMKKPAPNMPIEILDDILENSESEEFKAKEKLELYVGLCGADDKNMSKLYDLCIESGLITKGEFDKSKLFGEYFRGYSLEANIEKLENVKYRKLGDYFFIISDNSRNKIVNSAGKEIFTKMDYYDYTGIDSSIFNFFPVEKTVNQNESIKSIKEIIEKYDKETGELHPIKIIEDMVCLTTQDWYEPVKFYTITSDGIFKEIELRRRKKIYR